MFYKSGDIEFDILSYFYVFGFRTSQPSFRPHLPNNGKPTLTFILRYSFVRVRRFGYRRVGSLSGNLDVDQLATTELWFSTSFMFPWMLALWKYQVVFIYFSKFKVFKVIIHFGVQQIFWKKHYKKYRKIIIQLCICAWVCLHLFLVLHST